MTRRSGICLRHFSGPCGRRSVAESTWGSRLTDIAGLGQRARALKLAVPDAVWSLLGKGRGD